MARQKRVERFQTKRFRNPGGTVSWRVTGTLPNGDRIRENYGNKTDATNRKAELEGEAAATDAEVRLRATSLTEDQLADAETALEAAGNRSLSGVVHKLQQVEQVAQDKGTSVNAMLRFFQQHFREEIQSVTLLDAYDRFMAAKEKSGIYPRTVTFYRNSVKLLLEPNPSRFVHEIRVADLEKILGRYPNLNTRQTYRRAFTTFFAWAKRHHHCLDNPCERLDKIPADDKRIAILSLPEIKRLLKAATEWKNGSMTASVALALFAGLRPSEIAGLAPEDIRENGIRVRGGKLRRKTSRMVPIPANLRQWLAAYPFTGLPSHHQRSYRVLRKATKARNWAQDVLRHTSISFQLDRDQDEARTLFNTGTSKQMVDRHYREVIEDREEVEAFWNLLPESVADVEVPLEEAPPTPNRIHWPSDKRLMEMVASLPMTQVGKELGVSDNAVRKRMKKRGLG